MGTIKLQILKTSETGKKIIQLWERKSLHYQKSQDLAKELGFENAWIELGEIRGRIGGFSIPNESVDLKKYCRPDEHGMYRPRASQKETWEKIYKIGAIEKDELHKIIGIRLSFFERVGLEELEDSFIIEIEEEWQDSLSGNTDVQVIKNSEYYLMKGE